MNGDLGDDDRRKILVRKLTEAGISLVAGGDTPPQDNGYYQNKAENFLEACVQDDKYGAVTDSLEALQQSQKEQRSTVKRNIFILPPPADRFPSLRSYEEHCYWNGKNAKDPASWIASFKKPPEKKWRHDRISPPDGEILLVMREELRHYLDKHGGSLTFAQRDIVGQAMTRDCEIPKILKQIWFSGDKKDNTINTNLLQKRQNFLNRMQNPSQWRSIIYTDDIPAAENAIKTFKEEGGTFPFEIQSYEDHVNKTFDKEQAADIMRAKNKETTGEGRNLPGASDPARAAVLCSKNKEDAGGLYADFDSEGEETIPTLYAPCGIQLAIYGLKGITEDVSGTNQFMASDGSKLADDILKHALTRMTSPYPEDPDTTDLNMIVRHPDDRELLNTYRTTYKPDDGVLQKQYGGNIDRYLVEFAMRQSYEGTGRPDNPRLWLTLLKGNQVPHAARGFIGLPACYDLPNTLGFLSMLHRDGRFSAETTGSWIKEPNAETMQRPTRQGTRSSPPVTR